ncbi:hypothetical protein SLE2022_399640 [Rubroshorea leprosula]
MYSGNHNILLVGEGDFSFSLTLATRFGSASNIVATSLDSREELVRKYSKAEENLNVLEYLGCKILHGIDVHTMSKHSCLKRKLFDRIVFNFPHAGFFYRESDNRQIRLHQYLVRGFLRNAKKMLEEDGEAHITHKTGYPYDEWGIENIAEEVGLFLKSQVPFHKDKYPGYVNKRGDGTRCNETFPVGRCSTFKFKKPAPALIFIYK